MMGPNYQLVQISPLMDDLISTQMFLVIEFAVQPT